ncbi:hypothetical protein ACICHK_00055 [Streptomyces sp. AHU1]|uniref:hypothetical protein n=1 Tax=Streptomyces sp. AHU1 TaxID=3377215 RepID=UPI003877BF06
MPVELSTQAQFDVFTDAVARELGTHCRTAPGLDHMLSRVIIDDEGRALSLRQHDSDQPARLKVYAALPGDADLLTPSIGVTASSARHVAQQITRRLYPLHAEISQLAAELAAKKEAEARARRTVAETIAGALPGARVHEQYRRTDVHWQRAPHPQGQPGPVQIDRVDVVIGASGEGVNVEVSGHLQGIAAMLAAFAAVRQD